MILYMNKKILILSMALMASVCFIGVGAAAPDKVTFLQDENFFLQDEIKKLQAELIDKDNAFKKLLLERETVRYDLDVMAKEKGSLEEKIASLTKMVASCDVSMLHNAEQAVMPYRSQLKDAVEQLKIMAMTLEEKNVHIARVSGEIEALQAQSRTLTAEKMSLLQSIRKISGEYDELKGKVEDQVADAKDQADAKVKDFQVRLAAEQTLVQEKIDQAKKSLENKITAMEAACKLREAQALQQGKLPEALLQEKIRKLEQQIVLLRENAGLEVKKVQDDAAAEIKKLKDQLDAVQAVKK
jgi:chromosome segregation ATPase